jgi:hypothetical protein
MTTPGFVRSMTPTAQAEYVQLEKIAEDAIQISHRLGGATQLLALHRQELDQLRGRLADTVVAPEGEPWKRDALQTYATRLEQIDLALAALGVA